MIFQKLILHYSGLDVHLMHQHFWSIFPHNKKFYSAFGENISRICLIDNNISRNYSSIKHDAPMEINSNKLRKPVIGEKGTKKYKHVINRLTKNHSLDENAKNLLANHSKKLARFVTNPEGIFILDKRTAESIFKLINPKLSPNSNFLFEVNPGPGVMTEVFLENTVNTLRIFETRIEFLPYLEVLKAKYKKLEIVNTEFLKLGSINHSDLLSGKDTISSLFKNVKYTEWINLPPLQIFAILPNSTVERRFLSFILHSFISFQNIFRFGRTQLFLFVSGKEFQYMTATPHSLWTNYRNISVLYQTFFDIELLHVEPRSSFFPSQKANIQTKRTYDGDNMYLMHLMPKRFLFDVLPPALLPDFGFFISHHLQKRNSCVISSLEKWILGSHLHYFKQVLKPETKFGELTPTQLLVLFLHFSSMNEYPESSFRAAAKMSDYFIANLDCDESDQE